MAPKYCLLVRREEPRTKILQRITACDTTVMLDEYEIVTVFGVKVSFFVFCLVTTAIYCPVTAFNIHLVLFPLVTSLQAFCSHVE